MPLLESEEPVKLPEFKDIPKNGIQLRVLPEIKTIDLTVFVNLNPQPVDPFYAGNIRNRRAMMRLIKGGLYAAK